MQEMLESWVGPARIKTGSIAVSVIARERLYRSLFEAFQGLALLPELRVKESQCQKENRKLRVDFHNSTAIQSEGVHDAFRRCRRINSSRPCDLQPLRTSASGSSPTDPPTGFHKQEKETYTVHQNCRGTFTSNHPPLMNPTSQNSRCDYRGEVCA
jgi:hypothetical protein